MTFFERLFRFRRNSDPFAIIESPLEIDVQESPEPSTDAVDQGAVTNLKNDIRKLGRTQFRANAVAESDRKEIKQMLQRILETPAGPELETLKELLIVVDGIEEAIRASEQLEVEDSVASAWGNGLRILHERMLLVLKKWHVTPIEALKQPFEPHYHRAVGIVHTNEVPENTVVEEQRRGYLCDGAVLRYSEVIVARKEGNVE